MNKAKQPHCNENFSTTVSRRFSKGKHEKKNRFPDRIHHNTRKNTDHLPEEDLQELKATGAVKIRL